jgi:hypothetical protein
MITSLPAGHHTIIADITVTRDGVVVYTAEAESILVSSYDAGFILITSTKPPQRIDHPAHVIVRVLQANLELTTCYHTFREESGRLRMWGGTVELTVENVRRTSSLSV